MGVDRELVAQVEDRADGHPAVPEQVLHLLDRDHSHGARAAGAAADGDPAAGPEGFLADPDVEHRVGA